jgi:hypothetical protein
MTWRDLKASARAALHENFQVAALYVVGTDDPVAVNVRVHYKPKLLGDQQGTSLGFAEMYEKIPSIIFLASEVPSPARGAWVSISADEAYRIDHVEPADGLTITANCAVATATQRAALPVPE